MLSYKYPGAAVLGALAVANAYFRRLISEWRPDVIFAHHSAVNGVVAEALSRRYGLPFVVTDHDFDEIRDCERLPWRRRAIGSVVQSAAAMVAVSSPMRVDLERIFPGANVHVVHNGVDPIPRAIRDSPRPIDRQSETTLLVVGMFYERKGIPMAIRAFSRIARTHPRAVLRIVGDGPERASVAAAIDAAGAPKQIVQMGKIGPDEVLQEMVWADAFVHPGWNEPFATVLIEAAAAGKPMIVSSDGGFLDVFRDGEHGIGFKPKDEPGLAKAMELLLRNAVSRRAMGSAAMKLWSRDLTWDVNALHMLAIFDGALRRTMG
jgi:glycosyltransferase involved in cell wall biosynthesis